MADAHDVAAVTREAHLPVLMVDVALPPMRELEPILGAALPRAESVLSGRGRLVVLNIHTVSGGNETGVRVFRLDDGERTSTMEWSTYAAYGEARNSPCGPGTSPTRGGRPSHRRAVFCNGQLYLLPLESLREETDG